MSRKKVLRINYHPDTIGSIALGKNTIDISVGNKSGISISEDGVHINCATPSRFTVSTGGISHCGFYQETPFPLCFLAGPLSMPSQIPQVPFGMENIQTMAVVGACAAAMASAMSAL